MTEYNKGRRDAIRRCAEIIAKLITCEKCPIFCDWVSDKKCAEYLRQYLEEHIDK